MEEIDSAAEPGGTPAHPKGATPDGKQSLVAIAVGAGVFAAVMFLILLAVRQAPPPVDANSHPQSGDISPADYAQYIVVENCVANLRTNALGARELEIKGYVKNSGARTVRSAALRSHFRTVSGGETSLEFPLVIHTRLDDMGGGPLMPMSGREFGVRAGKFPEGLEPEISRLEVINVRLQSQ